MLVEERPKHFYDRDGRTVMRHEVGYDMFRGRDGRDVMMEALDSPLFKLDPRLYRNYIEYQIDRHARRLGLTVEPPPPPAPPRRSRKSCWINVYLVDRQFGGREEGGWWYDCGYPEICIKVSRKRLHQELPYWRDWAREQNSIRRSDIGSVMSEGRYDVVVEDFIGKPWPGRRPIYE